MTPDTAFSLCNFAVLPGWLLLCAAPGWRWTTSFITSVLLPGLLGTAYLAIFLVGFSSADGGFGSIAAVRSLFADDWLLLGGWIHYLAFDLFVGSWEVRDARRLGIAHWFVLPCLAATFLAGPIGLLAWFCVRVVARRAWRIDAVAEVAPA